jgi:hypothetical protein
LGQVQCQACVKQWVDLLKRTNSSQFQSVKKFKEKISTVANLMKEADISRMKTTELEKV